MLIGVDKPRRELLPVVQEYLQGGVMRTWLYILACLFAFALLFGCNKQKAHQLDYAKKSNERDYSATGLPGQSYVGAPKSAKKFTDKVSEKNGEAGKESDGKSDKHAPEEENEKNPEGKK